MYCYRYMPLGCRFSLVTMPLVRLPHGTITCYYFIYYYFITIIIFIIRAAARHHHRRPRLHRVRNHDASLRHGPHRPVPPHYHPLANATVRVVILLRYGFRVIFSHTDHTGPCGARGHTQPDWAQLAIYGDQTPPGCAPTHHHGAALPFSVCVPPRIIMSSAQGLHYFHGDEINYRCGTCSIY